jgi:hypothetical protein
VGRPELGRNDDRVFNLVFDADLPVDTLFVKKPKAEIAGRGLPGTFAIENDEWYTYHRSPRPAVHVLANVDENSYVPARSLRMGITLSSGRTPVTKRGTRTFLFGHKADLFRNGAFKLPFLNAIRWASER